MSKFKAVFHIDFDSTPIFKLALTNIKNFIKDAGADNVEIAVLANGFAVKCFVRESNSNFSDLLEEFHELGVKFYVCDNALNAHNIDKNHLFEFCEIVPAGITKLVELQKAGYAYIKP